MYLYAGVALLAAVVTLIHKKIIKSFFTFRRKIPTTNPKQAFSLEYSDVYFNSVAGTKLHGWFIPAATDSVRGCVVLTPGWSLNTEYLLPLVQHIHSILGFHCLLLEARFHGHSEGDQSGIMHLYKVGDDIMSAVEYVTERKDVDGEKIGLVGFSMGAGGSMRAARNIPLVKFVVAISCFANFENVILHGQQKKGVPRSITTLLLSYLSFVVGFTYDKVSPAKLVKEFRKDLPLLISHGSDDAISPYSEFTDLHASAIESGLKNVHGLTIKGARHMNVVSNDQFVKGFTHFLENVVKPTL